MLPGCIMIYYKYCCMKSNLTAEWIKFFLISPRNQGKKFKYFKAFTLYADDKLLYTNLHSSSLFFPAPTVCRAVVHIQVNDVNEFAPVFREPQYRAAVTEGKIYDSILQVEATDQDCSPQYSQICNYQITTSNTPFAIDRNGE